MKLKRFAALLCAFILIFACAACEFAFDEAAFDDPAAEKTEAPSETEKPEETQEQTPAVPEETPVQEPEETPEETGQASLDEDGTYSSMEEVALYIHLYNKLPGNYITKKQAQDLGWSGGSLEPYAPGKCIGGSRFGNYEGLLPEKSGRTYTECDIDTLGAKSRGAKRIVFSNDGLIYYTDDRYESFTLLYGDEDE